MMRGLLIRMVDERRSRKIKTLRALCVLKKLMIRSVALFFFFFFVNLRDILGTLTCEKRPRHPVMIQK